MGNPFGQSLIWGEGSNYPQQYTALPGETVGEIPVGMLSRFNEDTPYWPQFNKGGLGRLCREMVNADL